MKALVTGDAGFIGSHFVDFLKDQDWEVYGLDIKNDPAEDAQKFFEEDNDEWVDLVVHCAYEVGGRAHIDGTNMALANNVAMDAAMFKWALRNEIGAVLYFSSSAAYSVHFQGKRYVDDEFNNGYGDPLENLQLQEDLIDLDYPRAPDANYGWAKVTGEKLAASASALGQRVHIIRPFSGYSENQSLDYPFPSIAKRAKEGNLVVWGPKGQTRDWIHVDDVIRGSYAVYLDDERRPVNACTGVATEMGDLMMTMVAQARGCAAELSHLVDTGDEIIYDLDKPTGVFYRVGDPTRFHEHYLPQISIEEGVERAIGAP